MGILEAVFGFVLRNWKLVLLGLMLAAIGYLNWRLESCKSARHEDQVLAEAREKALGDTISIQNRAVEALEEESRNRIAKAQKGLEEASRAAQGARNEAARLRALASTPPSAPQSCPAGDALQEVRKGLGG